MIDEKVFNALLLTSMGAAGTALGAFLVVLQPSMQFYRLGVFQGIAGGLMLSISVFDLFQESQESVGTLWANVWFFAGVVFFAAVVHFIPEPDATSLVTTATPKKKTGKAQQPSKTVQAKQRVLMSGLVTAVGIALHNFPEGVAVFLGSMKSTALGVSIACAIALHNIPEGVAVALPVYFATGSRWLGFQYAFLSGLAEPAAVVILGLLFPTDLDQRLVDCLLAAVGGIMAFLALSELLPLAIEHAGRQHAIAALFGGMALMSANLYLLHEYLTPHEHDHAH